MDVGILVAGVMGASIVWPLSVLWAMIILFVVAHFFMFCNIFRIPRRPELIWAVTFISLSVMTIVSGFPGWLITIGASSDTSEPFLVLFACPQSALFHDACLFIQLDS